MAILWFSEAMGKLFNRDKNNTYEDYNGFKGQLNWAAETHPVGWMAEVIKRFMIPNYEILVWIVISIELTIALSLGFGLFTRLGSLIASAMAINLWFLTLGWDEWVWTYPLVLIPHIVLFFSHSGKNVGIDRYFVNNDNTLINLIT